MSAYLLRLGSLVCTFAFSCVASAQNLPVYQFEGAGTSPQQTQMAFPTHQFQQVVPPPPNNSHRQAMDPGLFSTPSPMAARSANNLRQDVRVSQYQPVPGRSATYENNQAAAAPTTQLNLPDIYGPSLGNPFLAVPLNQPASAVPQSLPGRSTNIAPSYSRFPNPSNSYPAGNNFISTPQNQNNTFQPRTRNTSPATFSNLEMHPQQDFLQHAPDMQNGEGCAGGDCGIGQAGCDDAYVLPRLGSGRDCGGIFFTYDLLYWTVSNPTNSVIGDAASEGTILRGGVTVDLINSHDTSFIDYQFHSGHRFEFGNSDGCDGWLANVSFGSQQQNLETTGVSFIPSDGTFPNQYLAGWIDANGDNIDDDLDSDNLFGRFGEDTGTPDGLGAFIPPFDGLPDTVAPTDYDDLRYFPALFDTFTASNTVTITNFELIKLTRRGNFEWQYGFRYFDFKERFALHGTGGVLDEMHTVTKFDNQIIGLEVGGRYIICRPVGTLSIEGRFTAGANLQDARLNGTLASNSVVGSFNGPVNLDPQSFNHRFATQEFAPMGELRVTYTFPVSCNGAFRLGYTGMIADGIGRASEVMVYDLPRLGLNGSSNDSTVVVNAITAGFEFRR